jgi:hypothetical protein
MPARWLRIVWVAIVGAHAIGAVYAWRLLPHGFPVGHPRFWINQVLPLALIAAGIAAIAAIWRSRPRLTSALICAFVGLHAGMAIGWIAVFPATGARPATIGGVIASILAACAYPFMKGRMWIAGALVALVAGFAVPWAQRGPDPATRPAQPPRDIRSEGAAPIGLDFGAVHVDLDPVLRFISRSPDRGWTLFAKQNPGNEPSRVTVSAPAKDVVHIEAETALASEVYSHLNSYTTLQISGHRRLFLEFSPAPGQRIEVMYSEYPTGRPSRFAYVDAEHELHVVEADSGEKGPFTELAHGPLTTDLGITLYDEQQPLARIDLHDFAAQASTQLSPTAGWGVPENAIEFSLARDRPDANAFVFITLAGTSVGRGWDSVGHAPGVYRNRIDVHTLTTSAE